MKRKDRASVLIFCVILMAAVGTIVLSTADMGRMVYRRQAQIERDAKYDYALDGLVAVYTRRIETNDVIIPTTEAFDVGGLNFDVDLAFGTGTRTRFVDMSVGADFPGLKRTRTYAIGSRGAISPMWFALGADSDFTPSANVTVNGDAYFGWDFKAGGTTCSINGDLHAQKDVFQDNPVVTGKTTMEIPSLTQSLDSAAYSTAASLRLTGNQTVIFLPFVTQGAFQSMVHTTGNVTFNVTYSGKGTYFVKGNAIIEKFDRNGASDEGLIIVDGNVEIRDNRFDGFLICNGTLTYNGPGNFIVNGAIWSNVYEMNSKRMTVNFDSFFWDDPKWDKRMRVPGMW